MYLARDIPEFVMYCVHGTSPSSLLIESTDSMTSAMQSINGASLNEHWAAQHFLHGSNSSTT